MRSSSRLGVAAGLTVGVAYWALVLVSLLRAFAEPDSLNRATLVALVVAGLPLGFLLARAISRRAHTEAAVLALKDDLTGLPNRTYFMDQLQKALARADRQKRRVAVLFIDLDRFKVFNDTMGHAAGDKLIIEVGRRIRRQVRSGETLARLGGDEFTVLLEGLAEAGEAETAVQRILDALAGPALIEGHEVFVTASVGIALSTGQYITPDELVRRADVALYQAKADGRSCFRHYDPGQNPLTVERLEMDADLRSAIKHEELRLYYQPEVELATGEVVGFEALIRWQHADKLLLPLDFLPAAEEAGLMQPIGRWVLRQACREAASWPQQGRPLTVAVNVSPAEFRPRELVADVIKVLAETRLEPSRLKLEIVENALMKDTEATIDALNVLREVGVKLAIDDFGTGYSSLNYLRHFPVNTVKIDRQFISEATEDERVVAVIDCIVSLAHALGMDVVAEGVETAEQLNFVLRAKCDRAQGFYLSRPLPSEALEPFVRSRSQPAAAPASRAAA